MSAYDILWDQFNDEWKTTEMYENSVSMYVLILSTVHQIDAPKINFFTQSHKKNNKAQALFAVTEDSEGFLLEISL